MELILLAHVFGDFYLQNDKIAIGKKQCIRYLLLHCLLYTIATGVGFYILYGPSWGILGIVGIIFLSHFVVDWTKVKCELKIEKGKYLIFLMDQIIHILILLLMVGVSGKNFAFQMDSYPVVNSLDMGTCILAALAVLVCGKPAAIFVALVFEEIPGTIEQADKETGKQADKETDGQVNKETDEQAGKETGEQTDVETGEQEGKVTGEKMADEGARIGSWIGILEREIILMLGLMGQFGAIGFVLTAKSLARFKQLENKSFAEKYLVGTLLSALIAIGCVVFCKISRSV